MNQLTTHARLLACNTIAHTAAWLSDLATGLSNRAHDKSHTVTVKAMARIEKIEQAATAAAHRQVQRAAEFADASYEAWCVATAALEAAKDEERVLVNLRYNKESDKVVALFDQAYNFQKTARLLRQDAHAAHVAAVDARRAALASIDARSL